MIKATGGKRVELGADVTWGHFEILDEVVLSATEVIVAAPSVLVATGTLEDLAMDALIDVDGTVYTVRDHRRVDDGLTTRILLKKA